MPKNLRKSIKRVKKILGKKRKKAVKKLVHKSMGRKKK